MRKQSTAIEMLDLQVFTAVVEQRSFSSAARRLATTTSAASKRVARLEALLGIRLLERTTRRVQPTDAGAAFHARAMRILADLGEAESELATLDGKPRGTLRVSAPLLLGERVLVPLLAPFLARYPDLRMEVALGDTFVDLLADRFDVALRVGALADSSLVRVKVGSAAGLVVASPGYLTRMGAPETPRDLVHHECLHYSNISTTQEWRFRSKRARATRDVAVPVNGHFQMNHGGGLRQAAIAGIGIARLPDFLVRDAIAKGELVTLLDAYASEPTGIHLVHAAGRPSPKVHAFVTEIGAALKTRLAS